MKRLLACLAACLLAITCVGCQVATEPAATYQSGSVDGLTLVSLKVPNMT